MTQKGEEEGGRAGADAHLAAGEDAKGRGLRKKR